MIFGSQANSKFSVAAVEQKSEFDSVASLADPEKNLVVELGILGVEIDPRIVDSTSGLRDPYGIVVAARVAGATSEVPILPRDVIRSLNDTKMYTLDQLRGAVRALKPGSAFDAKYCSKSESVAMAATFNPSCCSTNCTADHGASRPPSVAFSWRSSAIR